MHRDPTKDYDNVRTLILRCETKDKVARSLTHTHTLARERVNVSVREFLRKKKTAFSGADTFVPNMLLAGSISAGVGRLLSFPITFKPSPFGSVTSFISPFRTGGSRTYIRSLLDHTLLRPHPRSAALFSFARSLMEKRRIRLPSFRVAHSLCCVRVRSLILLHFMGKRI